MSMEHITGRVKTLASLLALALALTIALAACQHTHIYNEGGVVLGITSLEYGSGEATKSLADGAAEALPIVAGAEVAEDEPADEDADGEEP